MSEGNPKAMFAGKQLRASLTTSRLLSMSQNYLTAEGGVVVLFEDIVRYYIYVYSIALYSILVCNMMFLMQ